MGVTACNLLQTLLSSRKNGILLVLSANIKLCLGSSCCSLVLLPSGVYKGEGGGGVGEEEHQDGVQAGRDGCQRLSNEVHSEGSLCGDSHQSFGDLDAMSS